MAREARLDDRIDEYCKQVGACARKIHGSSYQKVTTDWLICFKGVFIALESKSPEGGASELQKKYMRDVRKAGGIAETIYDLKLLKDIIKTIREGGVWEPQTDLCVKTKKT